MNRFLTEKKPTHTLRRIVTTAAVFCCSVFLLTRGIRSVSQSADESQQESLRQAILRSAVHCYAVEGRYPESLAYITEHYGITWDLDRYLVDYEIIGSNLMPDVTVIPLNKKEDGR